MILSFSSENEKGSPGKRTWYEQPLGKTRLFSLLKDRLSAQSHGLGVEIMQKTDAMVTRVWELPDEQN